MTATVSGIEMRAVFKWKLNVSFKCIKYEMSSCFLLKALVGSL